MKSRNVGTWVSWIILSPIKEQLYNALVGNDTPLHWFGVLLFWEWQSGPDHDFRHPQPQYLLYVTHFLGIV